MDSKNIFHFFLFYKPIQVDKTDVSQKNYHKPFFMNNKQ
jgi:hypothetical protein